MNATKSKGNLGWPDSDQSGYRFPLVHLGLDFETQSEIERAMEELMLVTTARISEAPSRGEA
jgi:hypothetical protein